MNPPVNYKTRRKAVKVSYMTNALLVYHLLDGVHSCQELADLTGLHYVTVLNYTRAMHRQGAIHICEWEKDGRGRDVIKIYKMGIGKDKARRRKSGAQKAMDYRAKLNQMTINNALAGVGSPA